MKFVKITDNNAKAVTEIELAYGNSIQDFFIVTGVDCTAFNNTFVVKSVGDCIRRALDWKYSVNDFSTDSPDKDGRHVYVNGREIDAFSSVARQIAYKGYNEREYKEHIDMVNADYAISLLNTSKIMTLKGLKEMEGSSRRTIPTLTETAGTPLRCGHFPSCMSRRSRKLSSALPARARAIKPSATLLIRAMETSWTPWSI